MIKTCIYTECQEKRPHSIFGPCFVMQCLVLSCFAIISLKKRELVALFQLLSCCHVAIKCSVSLHDGAVGCSVVYDCGISCFVKTLLQQGISEPVLYDKSVYK